MQHLHPGPLLDSVSTHMLLVFVFIVNILHPCMFTDDSIHFLLHSPQKVAGIAVKLSRNVILSLSVVKTSAHNRLAMLVYLKLLQGNKRLFVTVFQLRENHVITIRSNLLPSFQLKGQ